jgi:tellurite resistance protein
MNKSSLISKLEHLAPAWFVLVMGWCGLTQTWLHGRIIFGDFATGIGLVCFGVSVLIFGVLCIACILRLRAHPDAVQADLMHPVRHAFMATLPISMMLISSIGAVLFAGLSANADLLLRTFWLSGSILELASTVWVLSRWMRPPEEGGLQWKSYTPIFFIPIVGNVLSPIGGVPLGLTTWSTIQLGIGVALWPVALCLLFVRFAQAGPLPTRLNMSLWITLVPPSIIGVDLMLLQAPAEISFALWGVALFFALWCLTQMKSMLSSSFGLPQWSVSFPLAAFSIFTVDLSATSHGTWLQIPATLLIAITSLVITSLSINTWHAMRQGLLLIPEN